MEDVRDADSPFGPSARADIVLRSSDNVDFYALKAFLSYSSSFFDDMFSLPPPVVDGTRDQRSKNDLPIIEMQEESRVVRLLLCFCYPNSQQDLDDIHDIDDIVQTMFAVEKYAADTTGKYLSRKLVVSPAMTQNPLRAFAIAFRFGWKDAGQLAAKNTLSESLDFWPFSKELSYLTGVEMFHLGQYRKTCGVRVTSSAKFRQLLFESGTTTYIWWQTGNHDPGCGQIVSIIVPGSTPGPKPYRKSRFVAGWWEQYRDGLLERLKACPRGATAHDEELLNNAMQKASSCPACNSLQCQKDLFALRQQVAATVEEIVSEVELNVEFR